MAKSPSSCKFEGSPVICATQVTYELLTCHDILIPILSTAWSKRSPSSSSQGIKKFAHLCYISCFINDCAKYDAVSALAEYALIAKLFIIVIVCHIPNQNSTPCAKAPEGEHVVP